MESQLVGDASETREIDVGVWELEKSPYEKFKETAVGMKILELENDASLPTSMKIFSGRQIYYRERVLRQPKKQDLI